MKIDLNKVHRYLERVPIVSNFKNLIDIFIAKFTSKPSDSPANPTALHVWKSYVHSKSKSQMAVMAFIPVVSNIAYAIINSRSKSKSASSSEKKATVPTPNPPIKTPPPTRSKPPKDLANVLEELTEPILQRLKTAPQKTDSKVDLSEGAAAVPSPSLWDDKTMKVFNNFNEALSFLPTAEKSVAPNLSPKIEVPSTWEEVIDALTHSQLEYLKKLQTCQPNYINCLVNKIRLVEIVIEKTKKLMDEGQELSPITVLELADPSRFKFDNMQWKEEPLNAAKMTECIFTEDLLTYREGVYTQDPANMKLGGGWARAGFVLEECMVAEEPQFMALLQMNRNKTPRTRSGAMVDDKETQGPGGSPTPLILTGLQRLMNVGQLYGQRITKKILSIKDLKKLVDLKEVKPVSLICLAAPRLSNPDDGYSKEVIHDLFNTLLASFELVKEHHRLQGEKGDLIVDGVKVGAGAFQNNPVIVCILQKLAAQHAGIDQLRVHQVDPKVQKLTNEIFDKIKIQMLSEATLEEWLQAVFIEVNERKGDIVAALK